MKPSRIFVSGFFHETHTFLASKTTLADFAASSLYLGREIMDRNLGNGSPMDGFLSFASEQRWEVVPGIHMSAMPSGMVTDEAVHFFRKHFFAALEQELHSLDGIFLVLHGATVSESCSDVEGEILEELHAWMAAAGKIVPVVGVLDLHANISNRMCTFSSCLYAYRKNPHTDARQSAVRAAEILKQILDRPEKSFFQLFRSSDYIIPPTGLGTDKDPMKTLLEYASSKETSDPDLVCINVWAGFAYADIADCGFSLSCCTTGDPETANRYLDELLALLKTKIREGYPSESQLDEALEIIDQKETPHWPVLLMEAADNIGGGTPGDATGILGPLLQTGRNGIVAIINDPEAVQQCVVAGTGRLVELMIGAKTDRFHGEPIKFKGNVVRLSDGTFELENKNSHLASMGGIFIDMGPCAVLRNDQAEILLTTRKTPPMDLGQLHSQGISPEKAKYVIVKAAVSHLQAYGPIAADSFYIDSPGLCTSNLPRLPYKYIQNKRIVPN